MRLSKKQLVKLYEAYKIFVKIKDNIYKGASSGPSSGPFQLGIEYSELWDLCNNIDRAVARYSKNGFDDLV